MKRSRLNPVSKKTRKKRDDEREVRNAYLKAHPYCEAKRAGAPGECFGALHIHEPWTRARGGPTDDPRNMRTVCDHHNRQISQDVDTMVWAKAHGFLVSAEEGPAWLSSAHGSE